MLIHNLHPSSLSRMMCDVQSAFICHSISKAVFSEQNSSVISEKVAPSSSRTQFTAHCTLCSQYFLYCNHVDSSCFATIEKVEKLVFLYYLWNFSPPFLLKSYGWGARTLYFEFYFCKQKTCYAELLISTFITQILCLSNGMAAFNGIFDIFKLKHHLGQVRRRLKQWKISVSIK